MLAAVLIAMVFQAGGRKNWTQPYFWKAKEEGRIGDKVTVKDTSIEGEGIDAQGKKVDFVVELPTGLVGDNDFIEKFSEEENPVDYIVTRTPLLLQVLMKD